MNLFTLLHTAHFHAMYTVKLQFATVITKLATAKEFRLIIAQVISAKPLFAKLQGQRMLRTEPGPADLNYVIRPHIELPWPKNGTHAKSAKFKTISSKLVLLPVARMLPEGCLSFLECGLVLRATRCKNQASQCTVPVATSTLRVRPPTSELRPSPYAAASPKTTYIVRPGAWFVASKTRIVNPPGTAQACSRIQAWKLFCCAWQYDSR